MSDTAERATLKRADGRVQARFARTFEHDRQKLWHALTAPDELALWLAPGEIELREGGSAKIQFADSGTLIDSTVTAFDAGYLIEYSWSAPGEPQRPVRWELDSAGDRTHLYLTLQIPESEDAGRACAGWEAHLEMLAAALEGVPIKFPFETFKAQRDAYRALLA